MNESLKAEQVVVDVADHLEECVNLSVCDKRDNKIVLCDNCTGKLYLVTVEEKE